MKILIIHNNYGIYTGEEAVVDKQIALFEAMGHRVSVFRKTTEGYRGTWMGDVKGFLSGFYSPSSVKEIKQLIRDDRPDRVIVHNLYPYISPAVLKPIHEAGIPIIMTVHNYRLMCPTGLFMRDSRPCELCLKGKEWNCIRHNCEHSMVRSIGYAGRNRVARITGAYKNNVDRYACITQFQIRKLSEAGYDQGRMVHIPNFLDNRLEATDRRQGDYVAYVGRVSKEKGIDLIMDVARKTPHIHYKFAGTVRVEDNLLTDVPANCEFLGNLSKEALPEFYSKARFVVMASRCYEGFPLTILEAASYEKATIAPGHAGFLEIIDNNQTGLHFTPGDADDLQQQINRLWDCPDVSDEMGRKALEKLATHYSAGVVKKKWSELLLNLGTFVK